MRFIDLFCGAGGFHYVLKDFECVLACDIDDNAKKTYQLNYGDKTPFFKDIRNIDKYPSADLICAGFPCQSFSIAGKKGGFNDDRGMLFFDLIRIIENVSPRVVVLENVKNIVNHNNGETLKVIIGELNRIGYKVSWKILNTRKFTKIPQNRERCYFVCTKDILFNFPDDLNNQLSFRDYLDVNVDSKYYSDKEILKDVTFDTVYQLRRNYLRDNKNKSFPTLTANMGTGGNNIPFIRDELGVRRLTPIECFRIQGFNDILLPDIADCHLYKQSGNAITVDVFSRLWEVIYETYFKDY